MINIVFFAKYREMSGLSSTSCASTEAADLTALRALLTEQYGSRMAGILDDPRCLTACNQQLVTGNAALHDGDEVAFFPPVTGG